MNKIKNKESLGIINYKLLIPQPVVGVDEVGRGCLAGPVYAAAVVLNQDIDESSKEFKSIQDSKKISVTRRDELSAWIQQNSKWSIAFASVEEIDQFNILQASLLAMHRAVCDLVQKYDILSAHIAIDGNQKIKSLDAALGVQNTFKQECYISGDSRLKPIAAASILAKVERDRLMQNMDLEFPKYGFASHKGYGSEQHRKKIQELGPCLQHRKTFSGVREYI